MNRLNWLATAAGAAAIAVPALACDALRIVEIRIDEVGTDNNEYVELLGPPNFSLEGIWYIVIGDADGAIPPTQNGVIEVALNLSEAMTDENGLLLIGEPTLAFGTPHIAASLNFENSDNVTHLLVAGFSGELGQDLDTNDDGVLDVMPWTAVLCSVALVEDLDPDGIITDFYYDLGGDIVGPDNGIVPAHVWRCSDSDAWQIGLIEPVGFTDTPGELNPACGEVPAIAINEIRVEQAGDDNDEYVELIAAPGTSLVGLTYVVIGDAANDQNSGVIEEAIPLDFCVGGPCVVGPSGFFLIAEDADTLGVIADLIVPLNFEPSDNVSHFLVQGFTGRIGDDLDINDDGVLDITPWSNVVDSIAIIETPNPPSGTGNEWSYGPVSVGPDGAFLPGHVYRCSPNNTWTIGNFDTAFGVDTPRAANAPCVTCGNPGSGGCFEATGTPGCNDVLCCEAVCAIDVACCETGWDGSCVKLADSTCLAGGPAPELTLSEIRIDQSGTDFDEFAEIVGAPGTSLDGVTYIVLGDGTGGSGVIEAVVNLSGHTIPGDGFFVLAEETFTLGGADLLTALNFENGNNVTHLLVFNFNGSDGQDLDTNDDGVLDIQPWQSVIDSVGVIGPDSPPADNYVYSDTVVGPDGTFFPAYVYRCTPDGVWTVGGFDPVTAEDSPGAPNAECGVVDVCGQPGSGSCFEAHETPGCEDGACCSLVCDDTPACCEIAWDNLCAETADVICAGPGEAPDVVINEVRIDQPGNDDDEWFEIAGKPGTSLAGVTYIVIGDGSAAQGSGVIEAVVNLGSATIPASGYLVVAESTFTLGVADLTADLNFENSDNVSHFLVFNFTGSNGQDIDTNDDGVLDVTPWDAVIDSIALIRSAEIPPVGTEYAYGPTIGPEIGKTSALVPGHVYRCSPTGAWTIGAFDPSVGTDTPGAVNPACDTAACPADFNGDGVVDGSDLGQLLGNWGGAGLGDLDGSGAVDGSDLGQLLAAWGACAG